MKRALLALKVLALGTVAFLLGAWAATTGNWGQPLATVRIENNSGQALRQLELHFSGHAATGMLSLPALKDGEHVVSKVYVAGEAGYKVRAVLVDGTVLPELEGYVEAGYRTNEVVRSNRAISATGNLPAK